VIHLSPPDMTEAERAALLDAFDSGWVAPAGPDIGQFESEMCAFLGLPEGGAAALSSGTAAIHLGLLLLGVQPGDAVWVSDLTFAASANAVAYVGATPVFVDVDPATWQLDADLLERSLAQAEAQGALPAAVIAVDLYGWCPDLPRIQAACDRHGVPLLEDAAEALGARAGGRMAGTHGDVAALSFNGNKLITTGGGGMLLSRDPERVARARYLATQARQPVPHYEHTDIGFNYRLSNLLAALGRAQLRRVPALIARRREIRRRYEQALADVEGLQFAPTPDDQANHWLTCVLLDPEITGRTPAEVCAALIGEGIEARPLWKPMSAQPVFHGVPVLGSGHAASLFARGLCLPSGSVMADADVDRVVASLRRIVGSWDVR
jgi:pyridoxal phosphate-dependent aminotransferase EpsN